MARTRSNARANPEGHRTPPPVEVPRQGHGSSPTMVNMVEASTFDATMQMMSRAVEAATAPRREAPYLRMHQLGATYFYGATDPLQADTWMRQTEKILNLLECNDQEKVTCTQSLLQGSASY
jgi:hypothetical protein